MRNVDRSKARQLAQEFLSKGQPTDWFEPLYASADWDENAIPWAELKVNPHFAAWIQRNPLRGVGKRALVIGCGLGDDAEELSRLGFDVVAFDISKTAIDWCRKRFLHSSVNYCAADLFHSPKDWNGVFDFVLEAYTLQVLPSHLRPQAIECIAQFVVPGGTLLIIARGRDEADDPGSMPWPLTREELNHFQRAGLREVAFEDFFDEEEPPVRRFRVEYRAS